MSLYKSIFSTTLMSIIFTTVKSVVDQINVSTSPHERFWWERVLALLLQENDHPSFPLDLTKVGLSPYTSETLKDTTSRISSINLRYKPLSIHAIAKKLTNFQPITTLRKAEDPVKERTANTLASVCGREQWSLLYVLQKLEWIAPSQKSKKKKSQSKFPTTWKEWFLNVRNWGKKQLAIIEQLLSTNGIDPYISFAEIEYFKSLTQPTE